MVYAFQSRSSVCKQLSASFSEKNVTAYSAKSALQAICQAAMQSHATWLNNEDSLGTGATVQ